MHLGAEKFLDIKPELANPPDAVVIARDFTRSQGEWWWLKKHWDRRKRRSSLCRFC